MANVYLTIQRALSVFLFRLTSTFRVETKLPSYYPAFSRIASLGIQGCQTTHQEFS